MKKYTLVRSDNQEKFIEYVNNNLLNGYKLQGGIDVCHNYDSRNGGTTYYTQAMVKTTVETPEERKKRHDELRDMWDEVKK